MGGAEVPPPTTTTTREEPAEAPTTAIPRAELSGRMPRSGQRPSQQPVFSGESAPRYEHEAATVVTGSSHGLTHPAPAPPTKLDTPPAARAPVDQWKIRSPVGLVYDFPDLGALKSWLSSRDSVDGMSASQDGGVTWMLISDFPQLRDALPKSALTRLTASYNRAATGAAQTVALRHGDVTRSSATAPTANRASAGGPSGPTSQPPMSRPPPASVPPVPSSRPGIDTAKTTMLTAPRAAASKQTGRTGPRPSLHSGPRAALTSGSHPAISVRGATSGQPSIRQDVSGARRAARSRPPQRPAGRAARTASRAAGAGTYIGLILTSLILIVLALQVSGLVDFYDLLGLREPEVPRESAPTIEAPPTVPPQNVSDATASVDQTQGATAAGPQGATSPLDRSPTRQSPHAGRILSLTSQARQAADEGRIDDAIELVNRALLFDRTNPDLVCMIADLYGEAGALTQADQYAAECDTLRSSRPELSPVEER